MYYIVVHSSRPVKNPCQMALHPSASADGISCLFIGRTATLGLTLIPELFALGQSQFDFDSAVLKVQPRRDQRQTLLLGLTNQLPDLLGVHQQLSSPQRSVVMNVSMFVRPDVGVQQPDSTVFDQPI